MEEYKTRLERYVRVGGLFNPIADCLPTIKLKDNLPSHVSVVMSLAAEVHM